jgi:hypothetical protein
MRLTSLAGLIDRKKAIAILRGIEQIVEEDKR